MARNDSLNIRLNAQANITNIDRIKKELSQVMDNISLDKSVETSLNKTLERMTKLQKVFENISKKSVFNDKDIQKINAITEELENNVKQIGITMKTINMDSLVKSTTQYKTLMEDINKQTLEIKQNFKNLTGTDFDKEIKNIDILKNNIEQLNKAKQELQANGVSNEYNRLLDIQNQKLQEQETKLRSLKQLQSEITAYQNQAAQSKGYSSYEELQKLATTRTNKADFTNSKLLEAEQAEIKRLAEEYKKFENQLKRIEQYKNQASKTRGYKKLSEQLGIDSSTASDIDKIIKKMQELTEVTARTNVNRDNNLRQSINEQYNQLVQMRDAARDYANIIDRTSNAKISVSNATNAKTVSGLVNDIISTQATVNTLSSEDTSDNVMLQAVNNTTASINSLDSKLQELGNLFTNLTNTQRALLGVEGQERDFLKSAENSLGQVDTNTKNIVTNTSGYGEKQELQYNKDLAAIMQAGKQDLTGMVYPDSDFKKLYDKDGGDGVLRMYQEELEDYLRKAYSSLGENGEIDFSKFSGIDLLETEAVLEKINERIRQNYQTYDESTRILKKQIKSQEDFISSTDKRIKEEQSNRDRLYDEKATPENAQKIQNSNEVISELKGRQNQNKEELQGYKEQLQLFNGILEHTKTLEAELQPILDKKAKSQLNVEEAIKKTSEAQLKQLKQEDAKINNLDTSVEQTEENRVTQETSENLEKLNELKIQAKNRTDMFAQSLQKQNLELKNSSIASKTFNDTFGEVGRTLTTYISLNYIVERLFSTIKQGLSTVKAMDDSMTQIGIVTNKTAQEVWSSFETYNAQAKRLHMTTTDLLEATKLYYQQGLNTAEVNQMVEATAVAAALGEVSMADAANTLTAIMNGYSMAATQAMEVTDKISAVGADSAADFGELSSAIEKVASSAATAGVDLDHLLGYLGKMVEVTREAPTNIGSAMKTIVARMAELKEDPTTALEDGVDVNKVQTALRTVGIELFDTTNQMRDLDDIIDELGGKWNDLSRNSQAYLATVIAGNRQQSRFLALMNDYDRTMELVSSAQDSAGRSSQQFRNYATGIESSLNNVKAEAESFYASLTSGNNAIKGAYDLIADLLGLVNQLGPALTVAGTAVAAFFTKLATNRAKINKENALNSITNNVANNIGADTEGNIRGLSTQTIFGGVNGKVTNKLSQTFFTQGKALKELNSLIQVYNSQISQGVPIIQQNGKETEILAGVTQKQAKAITQLAKQESISVAQATQSYITQQKQNIGLKALTASTLAYTAAQAGMTLGISLIISLVVKAISHLSDMNAELRASVQASEETAQKLSDEANSLETLVNKYLDLTEKMELTAEEKEELKTVTQELIDQYPDLIEGISSEGDAYLKSAEYIKEYLKQKKIEALQKEEESYKNRLTLGKTTEGKTKEISITSPDVNPENAYNDTHKEAITNEQNIAKEIGGFEGGFLGMGQSGHVHWQPTNREEGDLSVRTYSAKDLASAIQKNVIPDLDEAKKAVEEADWNDETKNKLYRLIEAHKETLKAASDGAKEVNNSYISTNREIAIQNKNLNSEQSTLVESITDTFSQDFINVNTEDFKNDESKMNEWFENNETKLTDDLVNLISKAATGNNSEELQKAYDEYIQAQADGLGFNELNEKREKLFDLLRQSATSEQDKQLLEELFQTQVQTAQEDLDASIKQALGALKVEEGDANYDQLYEQLKTIFMNQNSELRGKIFESINEIMNNDDLFGGDTNQRNSFAQKMVQALSGITSDADIGPIFEEELSKLDINNAVDVKAFKEKWNNSLMSFADKIGMTDEEKQLFIEKIIPDPGTIMEDVTEAIKTALTDASSMNGQSFQDLFAGDYGLTSALDDGFDLGEGTVVGDQFLVNTSTIIDKMGEANEALKTQIDNLKLGAMEQGQQAIEQIQDLNNQINAIQLNAQANNRDLTVTEQSKIDELQKQKDEIQKQLDLSSQQIENAKRLNDQLAEQTRKQQLLASQSFYNDYNSGVNQQISSLKDLASAYDEIKEGELSQLDIIEMIANNSDMLTAVYVNERGELALNKDALENLAKAKIKAAIADGETKIAQLENLKSMIDANKYYTEDERQTMEQKVKMNEELEKDQEELKNNTHTELQNTANVWDSWVNTLKQNVLPAFGGFLTNMLGGISTFKTKANNILGKVERYIQSIADGVNGKARNVDDMMYIDEETYQKELNATGSAVNKDGVLTVVLNHERDDSADDTWIDLTGGGSSNSQVENFGSDIKTEGSISGQEYIDQIQKQIDQIRATNNALQNMYDSGTILENISNMGGSKDKSKKDEFEAYMEYFEKFYNYMKQIQNIEAKINRLREKRNIIDANKNYYIEDLKKENELLSQQAAIYNDYIRAQKGYLADLRNQISSAYGDLAYFTDEGLLQLKVSEVYISSESQEERIKEFQRLMEEYESQYESMQENETKLYEIESTQIQNITSMYDKLLQRLEDVRENLEFMQSISEHKITMAYGDLETLDLLNDKLLTTIDLWSNADKTVADLEADMRLINEQVQGSNLGQFLQWDQDLNQYRITDAFYDDLVRQEWESMGANWAEVTTWVTKTAKESEEVAEKWRDAKDNLMSAEETLKSIVEDRLSKINDLLGAWSGEFTKVFDVIQRALDRMSTEGDLFGNTPESLQKQYEATAAAASIAKANIAELKKLQSDALDEITQKYSKYVSMTEYGAYINETAIKESKELSESEKAILLEKIAVYDNITEALEGQEDKLYEYLQTLQDFEEEKRQAIIDIKTEIHDQLMQQDQKEVDDLQKKYDEMSRIDTEYYNSLQQKISDARDARTQQQSALEIDQMRAQIAVMQKDNTSQYNQELIELQKQLQEQLQAQADAEVDRELERIQREQQEREADRQLQIQQMENLITFKDENGIYWKETQAMMEAGRQEVESFLGARLEEKDMSEEERFKRLEERNEQIDNAFAEFSGTQYNQMESGNAETGAINKTLDEFCHKPVEIKDKEIRDKIGSTGIDVENTIDNMRNYLGNNVNGVKNAINTINDSRRELWSRLDKIYQKIYNPNYSSSGTGIVSGGGSSGSSSSGGGSGSSGGSGGYGSGDGIARKGDRVRYVSGWYYYDSNGSRPAGHQFMGQEVYITNVANNRAKPYHISRGSRLGNGDLGWVTLAQLQGYKTGGYVDFTGPTMVHGTKTKPEAFLNARQTELFEGLRDTLSKASKNSNQTQEKVQEETIQIDSLNINVQEATDVDSIDKIINKVKSSIYKDATSGNTMKIRRR